MSGRRYFLVPTVDGVPAFECCTENAGSLGNVAGTERVYSLVGEQADDMAAEATVTELTHAAAKVKVAEYSDEHGALGAS